MSGGLFVLATIPVAAGEVVAGPVSRDRDGALTVGDRPVPSSQGSSAMLAAALSVTEHLGVEPPFAMLGGDIGRGEGTRAVYERLAAAVDELEPSVVTFHYLQPIMALMRQAVGALAPRVDAGTLSLVADAGGMYAAKAAGVAPRFELMTPDVGEVGFLADENVTHPAYVSRYLFGTDDFDPVELARLAFERGGSSRVLLIKGAIDRIAEEGQVVATVSDPCVPVLEAIGGTGDTVTGLAAAFMAAGYPTLDAALSACRANRLAGVAMQARPDHRAEDLVRELPGVLREHPCAWSGGCSTVEPT